VNDARLNRAEPPGVVGNWLSLEPSRRKPCHGGDDDLAGLEHVECRVHFVDHIADRPE